MKPAAHHARACDLLGIREGAVRLIGPGEWRELVGRGVGSFLGKADRRHHVIYVRRGQGRDMYIHELLHHLFPSRPHWWVYGAAFKLAGVQQGRMAYGSWQHGGRVKESKPKLIALSKRAAHRLGLA